uniref:Rho-GAP domain-containing protein n=1 Tax=Heterorhabditis bacteriophora TaxID=37862 RepID=A0A1I7WLV1_HETBA
MNAGNLAIVFGPNLLGGDIDGNNAFGTKVNFKFILYILYIHYFYISSILKKKIMFFMT